MGHPTKTGQVTHAEEGTSGPKATEEVAAWLGLFLRTLKTSRLYDEANPTVVRFREEAVAALEALLRGHGSLRLEVGPNVLTVAGAEVLRGRTRDDNLAAVLYRDGIRALTFHDGIEAREVEALLDEILRVTGPSAGDEDLVTLLWDADLPHVGIETVPLEGDADGGVSEEGSEESAPMPWPKPALVPGHAPATSPPEDRPERSDDWLTENRPADLERVVEELTSTAREEVERFQREHAASFAHELIADIMAVIEDCCAGDLMPADRKALADFLPRVLREALLRGDWRGTSLALHMLRNCDAEWSVEAFAAELTRASEVTTARIVRELDRQGARGVESFLTLALEFGPPWAEWLLHVLAESQQSAVRKPLTRTIAKLLAGHPEHMIPWLMDRRWYVVRNAVHILGWIGGPEIAGYLRAVAAHEEPRVRREVVAALASTDPETSRPILLQMLKGADPSLFAAILNHLANDDHETVVETLLEMLRDENLAARTETERRAVFSALATRGDAVLPALDEALHEGSLFSRRREPDRTGIALCISRIGTPAARAILERGKRSHRKAIRNACQVAGGSRESSDG